MRLDRTALFIITAVAVIVSTLTLPLITVTHSFPTYNAETEIQVECGWLSSTANTGASARGIGSCGSLIRKINSDDGQIYLVVPAGVARQSEAIDYVAILSMPALVIGLVATAFNKSLFARVAGSNLIAFAAVSGVVILNLALGLRRSLHAAPDPGAVTTSSVGVPLILIVGSPVLALSAPFT